MDRTLSKVNVEWQVSIAKFEVVKCTNKFINPPPQLSWKFETENCTNCWNWSWTLFPCRSWKTTWSHLWSNFSPSKTEIETARAIRKLTKVCQFFLRINRKWENWNWKLRGRFENFVNSSQTKFESCEWTHRIISNFINFCDLQTCSSFCVAKLESWKVQNENCTNNFPTHKLTNFNRHKLQTFQTSQLSNFRSCRGWARSNFSEIISTFKLYSCWADKLLWREAKFENENLLQRTFLGRGQLERILSWKFIWKFQSLVTNFITSGKCGEYLRYITTTFSSSAARTKLEVGNFRQSEIEIPQILCPLSNFLSDDVWKLESWGWRNTRTISRTVQWRTWSKCACDEVENRRNLTNNFSDEVESFSTFLRQIIPRIIPRIIGGQTFLAKLKSRKWKSLKVWKFSKLSHFVRGKSWEYGNWNCTNKVENLESKPGLKKCVDNLLKLSQFLPRTIFFATKFEN